MNKLKEQKFSFLPLGAVKPKGWLKNQLRTQADGLSGHIDEFWDDLSDNNMWLGGTIEGWERGPYYVDGLLPLAYLLGDEMLMRKSAKWVEAFLKNQHSDGWIGPVKSEFTQDLHDHWPVFIVFKTLTQYYGVTEDKRVLDVMLRFMRFLQKNLDNHPLFQWGKFRWADLVISIHWLFEHTGESWLLKLVEKVASQGYDWNDHFIHFKYRNAQPIDEIKLETHVVNNAMALKSFAVLYRQTGDKRYLQSLYRAIINLDKFHGQVTGVFSGDEHLAGKDPSRGTELCAVVEYMFSLENIIASFGDTFFSDRLEQITYNALPATFTDDMWVHQYDQQANQVLCTVADKHWTNGPDANIFGLEPHFGCCTANMHQGWPKFTSGLWMGTEDGGLAAVVYAPCEIVQKINGIDVTITEETDYPFNETVGFSIKTSREVEFPLHLRIPGWCGEGSITLPDGSKERGSGGTYVILRRTWKDGDTIALTLPMTLQYERRYQGAVSITRGPLVFSLHVDEEWKRIDGDEHYSDWEVYPKGSWNYAVALNTENLDSSIEVIPDKVSDVPFSYINPPIMMQVKGKKIPDWKIEDNRAGSFGRSPLQSNEPTEEITLVPYGSAKLRISEFPLIEND